PLEGTTLPAALGHLSRQYCCCCEFGFTEPRPTGCEANSSKRDDREGCISEHDPAIVIVNKSIGSLLNEFHDRDSRKNPQGKGPILTEAPRIRKILGSDLDRRSGKTAHGAGK